MLPEVEIRRNLTELNSLFAASTGLLQTQFYAKLAIIEASTWIEIFIDDIFKELYHSRLTVQCDIDYYKDVIDKTYGFNYGKYIRKRLMKDLFGLAKIEKVENKLAGNADFIRMKASIVSLSKARNDCAHEPITGTLLTFIAPSQTIAYFNDTVAGIKVLRKELKKLR